MTDLVVDLFAGPGGWDEGARLAGYSGDLVGIDLNVAACRTAVMAGHARVCADVSTYPLEPFVGRVDGVIGSPPCTTFSSAGMGAGRALLGVLATAMTRTARGGRVLAATRRECAGILRTVALARYPKWTRVQRSRWAREQASVSVLVIQPLRWVLTLRPRWVALEQVPTVLPLWRHMSALLAEHGYRTWCGVVSAEQYGVPQTRRRAILTARRDGLPVGPPTPTHQPYRPGCAAATGPDLFGAPLPAPVSMAEALGWQDIEQPARTVAGNRAPRWAYGQGNSYGTGWTLANGRQRNATERAVDEPAPTVYCSRPGNLVLRSNYVVDVGQDSRLSGGRTERYTRTINKPSPTVVQPGRWTVRPATTVQGDARIWPPGHKVNADDLVRLGSEASNRYGDRAGTDAYRVTVAEAAALQSFPPDYPWQGTKSQRFEQVGNAVPPLLAAAILRPLILSAERRLA